MYQKIGILLMCLFLVANVNAYGRGGKGHGGMKKILKQLELTKEQQEKLKTHREKNKDHNKNLRTKMQDARQKMKIAFTSNSSDGELRSLHSEIKALKNQKADARFEKMLFIRSILTAEQRVKFQQLKEERREKKRNKRGWGKRRNGSISE